MKHVVLLGDSVFDNSAYVPNEPDVIEQLKRKLTEDWKASLLAVDGDVTSSVPSQLEVLPGDATHLVVSVGGNDALGHIQMLGEPAGNIANALERLAAIRDGFEDNYGAMLEAVLGKGLPTAICSIYYPRFPDPQAQRLAITALTFFNEVILRKAFLAGVPVLDLRLICDSDLDYANPIEPSARGGEKITSAIMNLLIEHDFGRGRTELFTG